MIEKVTKLEGLIKLAVNNGATENEARSAAFHAVKLIEKYGFLEYIRKGVAGIRPPTPTNNTYSSSGGTWSPPPKPPPPPAPKNSAPFVKRRVGGHYHMVNINLSDFQRNRDIHGIGYDATLKSYDVAFYVLDLLEKANNQFLRVCVAEIVSCAETYNIISIADVKYFEQNIRAAFKGFVSEGKLSSSPGRGGGYYLRTK